MTELLIILTIILAIALIILVTIQPRQTQIFSMDSTSNIGKPSYWQSNTLVKVLTLLVSLSLFVLLLLFMVLTFN
ncbi:accessory secretory protein Asp5 [Streptococcus sp. oral taxon 431]|uniref:accessory Sec system protein Asp5 n=1 Tax=Streptococcus sp. oral taxon 431 TaxID=712633 RepID=UPI003566255C